MSQTVEEHEVMWEEIDLENGRLVVYVAVDTYSVEYLGSDDDEEYTKYEKIDDDIIEYELRPTTVRTDGQDVTEYSGEDAERFLQETALDSWRVEDLETVRLVADGTVYYASFDANAIEFDDIDYIAPS